MKFKIGDSVRVKKGTPHPDFPEFDIGGWQGRVTDVSHIDDPEEPVVGLELDSITLRSLPEWYLADSEQEGLDWSRLYLSLDELEPAKHRDTKRDVKRVRRRIQARVEWLGIGPEGERIQAVVDSARSRREWDVMQAWEKYLKQHLQFPFEAEVDEFQEYGPLQAGDRLTVLGIVDTDEHYGVIVVCRKGRQSFEFPLADLAAVDEDSPNADPIQDYRVWFANR